MYDVVHVVHAVVVVHESQFFGQSWHFLSIKRRYKKKKNSLYRYCNISKGFCGAIILTCPLKGFSTAITSTPSGITTVKDLLKRLFLTVIWLARTIATLICSRACTSIARIVTGIDKDPHVPPIIVRKFDNIYKIII